MPGSPASAKGCASGRSNLAGPGWALGHASNPCSLLALARAAFGGYPLAWLITVPATDLAVGEGLSPTAEGGLAAALRTIANLLRIALEESQRGTNSYHG